jgi:2-C-methyl-D-erythritol 4-phosphate cytidylyltransferase
VYIAAIVVAAGRGTRMGTSSNTPPKAFLSLGGVPLLVHALSVLRGLHDLKSIVLVVGADHTNRARELLEQHGPWPVAVDVTAGGLERQDSVAAGLAKIGDATELVIVHDAARPFVSPACVSACIEAAAVGGAAIAAVPATDTLKLVDDDATIERTLERQRIWLAQTPQVFRAALLRRAYAQAARDGYIGTDDAALVEHMGASVRVVPGESTNRKITTPEDLRWAEWHLQQMQRGGTGEGETS